MAINDDAWTLLLYFYKKKANGEENPSLQELIEVTAWPSHRLANALEDLEDREKGYLDSTKLMGNTGGVQNRVFTGLTSRGVEVIEGASSDEGKREINVIFNITINNEFNIDSIIKGEAKLFG